MAAVACSYLPDELWECIFKFLASFEQLSEELSEPDYFLYPCSSSSLNDNKCTLKSLYVVSKQFLSIINRFRFCLEITDQKVPYLQPIYIRFPNLTRLNFTLFFKYGELDTLLCQICNFRLDLKSLILSYPNTFSEYTFPANGLLALSRKKKSLKSITCSRFSCIDKNDLFFIANCFPLLEELILTSTGFPRSSSFLDHRLLALPKLRKLTLSRNLIGHQSINYLCNNCDLLQEVKVIENVVSRTVTFYKRSKSLMLKND